jgi:protein-tyrosine phosphatase
MIAVFWLPRAGPGALGIALRPRGGDWLETDIARLRDQGIDVLVSLLTVEEQIELGLSAEAECCLAHGIQHVAAPVPDLGVPGERMGFVKLVSDLAANVSSGKSVAMHCRQSVGRSGLLASAICVALGEPLELALARVSRARGATVPETAAQREWLRLNETRLSGRAG